MHKPTIALAALAVVAAASPQPDGSPKTHLKEERMTVEHFPAIDRATVRVEAECEEPLARVEVRDEHGATLWKIGVPSGRELALSGFLVETGESSLAALFETYAAGVYDLRARTVDGRPARGSAVLSHELLPAPVILYPPDGAKGVSTSLIVSWSSDPEAAGYRVVLEQGESDGLAVELPRGSSTFEVPSGVLLPGTLSHVEVGAISVNGNSTVVEASFTTR